MVSKSVLLEPQNSIPNVASVSEAKLAIQCFRAKGWTAI